MQCTATKNALKKSLGEEEYEERVAGGAEPEVGAALRELQKALGAEAYEKYVREFDVAEDDAAREFATEDLGYLQAPVVYFRGAHWSGFHPDDVKAAARAVRKAPVTA